MRLHNGEANEMAQAASRLKIPEGMNKRVIKIQKRHFPTGVSWVIDIQVVEMEETHRRFLIITYLQNPSQKAERLVGN